MKKRDELLEEIVIEAKQKLLQDICLPNSAKYKELMKNFIQQVLCSIID
jgi:uncharacterized protein YaaR (DUF327 family)